MQRSGPRPGLDHAIQRLVQEFAIRRGRGKLRQRLGGSLQFGHGQSPLNFALLYLALIN